MDTWIPSWIPGRFVLLRSNPNWEVQGGCTRSRPGVPRTRRRYLRSWDDKLVLAAEVGGYTGLRYLRDSRG